jgi:hypothetical protein
MAMLQFCYYGDFQMPDSPLTLLQIAKRYEFSSLVDHCEQYLNNSISVFNVVNILKDANQHQAILLKEKCFQFIMENYDTVTKQPEFKNLPKDVLIELLLQVRSKVTK